MKVRRAKPYVCIDVDFAEHFRFQATTDIDAAAGAWVRCLAHSRAQEQDGVVMAGWLRRAFATTYERVEELVKVGLLHPLPDGNYEIHAYAPRNQTREMMTEDRAATRERVRQWRQSGSPKRPHVTRYNRVTSVDVTTDDDASTASRPSHDAGSSSTHEAGSSHATSPQEPGAALAPSDPRLSSTISEDPEKGKKFTKYEGSNAKPGLAPTEPVTPYKRVTSDVVTEYENVRNALVPTSTSINSSSLSSAFTSSSFSLSSPSVDDLICSDLSVDHVKAVPRAPALAHPPAERHPLPASERSLSGSFWLSSFSEGIREQTGRPCTVGRLYLGTLERIVTHHAPQRDPASASAWLKAQAKAFAAQWDGKHPAKGLTPDGLERWLNEGRQGPPVFGRPRIVQPPAEEWHEDDWSDLGAKVDK